MAFSMSVYFGTDQGDTLTRAVSDNSQDWIWGGAGNDWFAASGGDDFIFGGTGDDTIYGQAGRDWIDGGDGEDTITGGAENDVVYGGTGDDTIYGDGGNDVIYGGAGDATNASRQQLRGEDGDDVIYGGQHRDYIIGGNGDDMLRGGGGNDFLNGSSGNDVLYGDDGGDSLRPSTGDDVLTGGKGEDTFLFNNGIVDYGTNYVTDFKDGEDQFKLTNVTLTDDQKDDLFEDAEFWGPTTDSTPKYAGVTIDFADAKVSGLEGLIHIQFTEPLLDTDFTKADFVWS